MPARDEVAFGDLLRRQRAAAGLTQDELAERACLSSRGVSDLERGLRLAPHRTTVLRLADALGLGETERAALLASARRRRSHVQTPAAELANPAPFQHLTSFVGRERELQTIAELLSSARLLTLTGAGGIGKTRLALRAAADAAHLFSDGTLVVELAPLRDPGLVVHKVASTIGIAEHQGRMLLATLVEALRPRKLLLVLDNCEHLVQACAELVDLLLRSTTELRVLATGREPLGVSGETVWSVPPLSLGDPDATAQQHLESDAVPLFMERARAARPDFALTDQNSAAVADICRALDGIPLAIELAAARLRVLSPEDLLVRLRQGLSLLASGGRTIPERQRTLRAAVDWSYALLSDRERLLFNRLSVFVSGWTLEAAETVCSGIGIDQTDVLELLTALTDKSLVVVEHQPRRGRFRLLEPLRQYAYEQLTGRYPGVETDADVQAEAARVNARHADFFLTLAERAASELRGPDQLRWLERLQLEYDNMRAALRWCFDGGASMETGVRLAGALAGFWKIRGYVTEGEAWLERARANARGASSLEYAALLNGYGELAQFHGAFGLARVLHEESLGLRRGLGDGLGAAESLRNLGTALLNEGAAEAARMRFDESLAMARDTNDRWAMAASLSSLGNLAYARGDLEHALICYQESLALAREQGDVWQIAYVLHCLGHLGAARGFSQRALVWLTEGLKLSSAVDDQRGITACLESLAFVMVGQGRPELATRLLGTASAIRAAMGLARRRHIQNDYERTLAAARGALEDDRFAAIWAEGQALTPSQAIADVIADERLASVPAKARPTSPTNGEPLTPRQREVAVLIARGCSNHQIASELIIADGTAQRHVANILTKLGYESRTQIAVWAANHGLTSD